jgi:ParB family chromosome partitioning protein
MAKSKMKMPSKLELDMIFEQFGVESGITKEDGILYIPVLKLKPHPQNEIIYGQDEDVSDLVAQIEAFGRIIEPLKINEDYTIISGHRRWKAAQTEELKYDTVPCEFVRYDSPEEELAALVLYNYTRVKTNEQKAREGMALSETLSVEAVQRKLATLKQNRTDVGESPISETGEENPDADTKPEKGLTRDKVAEAVGIKSGRTFDDMKKVVTIVDELKKDGNTADAELYRAVLNRSVSAARDFMDVPLEKLTDEDKNNIKAGKVAPRQFLTVNNIRKPSTNVEGTAPYKKARKEIGILNDTIQALQESIQRIKDYKERLTIREWLNETTYGAFHTVSVLLPNDYYDHFSHTRDAYGLAVSSFKDSVSILDANGLKICREEVEEDIENLKELLSAIESELGAKETQALPTDKKRGKKKL